VVNHPEGAVTILKNAFVARHKGSVDMLSDLRGTAVVPLIGVAG
jgi:hypothetical protein